ncbi:MAG TPA: ABC transporter permease [Patescibacteria group bacterium]|nr:ABC transporter permease [Patescibacteria group bacterium]
MTAATVNLSARPSIPRSLGILGRQLRAELRLNVRAPEFVVPVLALPVLLYFIFGAPRAAEAIPAGTVGGFTMVGFSIYGVLNVVLFAIGESIADERGRGYLRLIRTTPLPSWAYLTGKLALAAVLIAGVITLIGVAGTITGAGVALERWLGVTAVLVLGGLALAPIGFLIGFLARPHGAGALALLILFPLSLASGVFMPIEQLPGIVRDVSMATPTYHLAELARLAAGFSATGLPATGSGWEHVAVVAAWSIAGFFAVAVCYRRMVARQFA